MENALLILHLVLVIVLIAVVLLQRSEGGALGMGGGGGGGGVMTGRGATTALQRVTWWVASGFIATSLALTVIATTNSADTSVFDSAVTEDSADPVEPENVFVPPTIIGDDLPVDGSVPQGLTPAPANGGGTAADPDNLVPSPSQN